MKKYNMENIENLLNLLKENNNENTLYNNFTNKVMDRIKEDTSFINDNGQDYIDDLLTNLSYVEEVIPKDNFTLNVMEKIKANNNFSYNEENIEPLLNKLSHTVITMPKEDFTCNVMEKIKDDMENSEIIPFEKVYKKFLIGSIVVAAAAVLLALNLFSHYDAGMAEFMVTDYFNTGLY